MPFEINPVARVDAIRPLGQHAEAAPAKPAETPRATGDEGVSVELDRSLAFAGPPVDSERVSEIRRALEDGTYPIVPTRIADAMIAARFMLSTAP